MLEKRTSELWPFDLDCTRLLGKDEVITAVSSVTGEPTLTTPLTFGVPVVNVVPVQYQNRTAAVGKVIQVQIGGGSIAAGLSHQRCTIRLKFTKSQSAGNGEATAYLDLIDTPSPP